MQTKKSNFIRLAEGRTNKIVDSLVSLSKLSNKNNYDYDSSQIKEIFDAIEKQLRITKNSFLSTHKKKFKFKLK